MACVSRATTRTTSCQTWTSYQIRMQVHEVAGEAIARARRGDGPTLIEAQTYRFRGHSLADPDELRPKEEKEAWQVVSFIASSTYRSSRP